MSEFDITQQPLDKRQKALVREAYERLEIWRSACAPVHDEARKARQILQLQDPDQDVPGASVKTLQLHTLKSTFNGTVADQMDNMPEALMLPETSELSEVAEDLTDVTRWVLSHNNYEAVHRQRVEDCFGVGTAVTQVTWDEDMDYGAGNIALIRWPIEAFLWDPKSETLQGGRAVFKVSWHPMSWFEQHYPDAYPYIGSDDGQYEGLGKPEKTDKMTDSEGATDEDTAMLLEYWFRMYDAKTQRYTISVAYLAGGALLDFAENVFDHGLFPFVPDVYTPVPGQPAGTGMMQELAPMMRYINRYAAYIDMNLRMSSKGRLLVNRNAGIESADLADWSKDIIEGDRIDPTALQWLQTQPFTGMVTAQMLQLQTDLKQDSGQNQFTRGETAGGVTAASAISALQEAGGKITRLRTHVLNQGFRAICEQIMWLVAQFYDKKRVVFITGRPDKADRAVALDRQTLYGKTRKRGKALPPPPYSVQVQVQRRNPLRVQAQNELFMQMYSMSAQARQYFPISVLLELLQVDGKEKILPVIRETEQFMQQMQQLMQQNEQLVAQNEQLAAGVQNLQGLNQKYIQAMRKGMYPTQDPTDQALPDVASQLTM